MSQKKNSASFIRQPAAVLLLQQQIGIQSQFNQALLELLRTQFPSIASQATQLETQLRQATAGLSSLSGELTLTGHGPKGVLLSQTLKSDKDNAAFLAKSAVSCTWRASGNMSGNSRAWQ